MSIDLCKKIQNSPISYQELLCLDKFLISGIYKIENKINHKVYIGQSKDIILRLIQHIDNEQNVHLRYAFNKYGLHNFSFEIIKETYDLNYWEIFLIQIYKATDNDYGYNVSKGGNGGNLGRRWYNAVLKSCQSKEQSEKLSKIALGHSVSEETKKKISNSIKRLFKDPEYRKKNLNSRKEYHWFNNGISNTTAKKCPEGFEPGRIIRHTISEETRKKQSLAHKGIKFTEEHKRKIGLAQRGKFISFKTRQKLSNIMKEKYEMKNQLKLSLGENK